MGVNHRQQSLAVRALASVLFCLVLLFNIGCEPVPDRELNRMEKAADMLSLFSIFEHYYAPLQYKEDRFNFEYDRIKQSFMRRALATETNEEFYHVMSEFVARFGDAHTAIRLTGSTTEGVVRVAYLGFSGQRKGEGLLVQHILPTIDQEASRYPIHNGDVITHINGTPLRQYILDNLVAYRDLGNEESNITFHMNNIFNRFSLRHPIPGDEFVELTVKRTEGESVQERKINLPWVVKDWAQFQKEQEEAAEESEGELDGPGGKFRIRFVDFENRPYMPLTTLPEKLKALAEKFGLGSTMDFLHSFRLPSTPARWVIENEEDEDELGAEEDEEDEEDELANIFRLLDERNVPKDADLLEFALTYPAYVTQKQVVDQQGKPTGATVPVGVIRIDTFSPGEEEDVIMEQLHKTLAYFQDKGVKDVIIDLLNNGGGSLSLVLRVAQAFSDTRVHHPGIQMGTHDNWMRSLDNGRKNAPSDNHRMVQERLYQKLVEARNAGERLMETVPVDQVIPSAIEPNYELKQKFNIRLLINEMCASAADVFAYTMKKNELAKLIGRKTMGAGGNVVQHWQLTNSKADIMQTESLLVGYDLQNQPYYLENNGVEPHTDMDVSESVDQKYDPVFDRAYEQLIPKQGPPMSCVTALAKR